MSFAFALHLNRAPLRMEVQLMRHLNIWRVLVLALLLRALLPIAGYLYTRDVTIVYTPDTASYLVPAGELIAHHRFFSDGAPEIVRTPGYPLLLTAGLLLGHLELVTIVLQILLSCFTVFMVYETACEMFEDERIALIGAALYALEPLSILFSSLLASETLFAAIAIVCFYYLVRYLKRQSPACLLASGAALAASVYIRPVGYFLPVIIAVGLTTWAAVTAQQNRPRLIAQALGFVIVSFALTSLWQVRNEAEAAYPGFSAIASDNMYFILAASVLAAEQHVPYYGMRDRLGYQNPRAYLREHPEQKTWSVEKRTNYLTRTAEHILLGDSLTYAWIYFDGILRGTFDPGSTEFLRFFDLYPKDGGLLTVAVDKGRIATVEALYAYPLLFWSTAMMLPMLLIYLSSACVTLCSTAIQDPSILAAWLIASYYMAIAGGPGDWGRFRHPVMPIICALAGYGLYTVRSRLRHDHRTVSKAREMVLRSIAN
jgi:4-amino-4-deoxy-L-arabinose transferase-like glycosyltransferase